MRVDRTSRVLVLACALIAGVCTATVHAAAEPASNSTAQPATSAGSPTRQQAAGAAQPESVPPTYESLVQALEDPQNRAAVIPRGLSRAAGLSVEQQKALLGTALANESPAVGRQAAVELQRRGWLEQVVRDRLLDLVQSGSPELRRAAIVALERVSLSQPPPEYWQALIEALDDEEDAVSEAAACQLGALGPEAVPLLLQVMKSGSPGAQQRAAALVGELVGSRRRGAPPGGVGGLRIAAAVQTAAQPAVLPAAEAATRPSPRLAAGGKYERQTTDGQLELVRVYFGSNREAAEVVLAPLWSRIAPFLLLAGALFGYTADTFRRWRETRRDGERPERAFATLLIIGILMVMCWSGVELNQAVQDRWARGAGPRFGPLRNADGAVSYGHCDVSLRAAQATSELPPPAPGPGDEPQYVVLRRTVKLDAQEFYEAVRRELAGRPADAHDCFVFVHGFNVSFEEAARRTAQIHHDLQFPGVPLFYSWPSRCELRAYAADRNEIEASKEPLKRFLIGLADQLQAGRVHIIAHGLGAAAVAHVLAEIERRDVIFNQIVLAAPDIDATAFRDQLVPKLVRHARRTTLYCSQSDLTLRVAEAFDDLPRAGDSNAGVLVAQGVDTVDAATIDTDLLGHSRYADAVRVLDDVALLLLEDLPPASPQRHLQPRSSVQQAAYWALDD